MAFYSLGEGNVPLFVADSCERAAALHDYFCGQPPVPAERRFDLRYHPNEEQLAARGLYMYVRACQGLEAEGYRRTRTPATPLSFASLPAPIRAMLAAYRLDLCAGTADFILPMDTGHL